MEKLSVEKIKDKTILAIGAHPDDLEFGVGGSLILLGKANRIVVAMVTSGQQGNHEADSQPGQLMRVREEEQRRASAIYQAQKVLFLQFPDMGVADQAKRLTKRLVKLLLRTRPGIVITHDPWSEYFPYHPDHRAVGFSVLDAVIAATIPGYVRRRGLGREALHPKPVVWLMHPNQPSHGVDVSRVWERKIEAVRVHESQWDEVLVWDDVSRRTEEYFSQAGKQIGVKYAEPIRVIDS